MPASSTLVANGAAATLTRHLRPRGAGRVQPTTTVELFFVGHPALAPDPR